MDFDFHPAAESEFSESVRYYDAQAEGLGDRFAEEITTAISRILRNPSAWRKLSRNTRRCLTSTFPYGIIYVVEEKRILILAVMHLKRKPDYWKSRLSDSEK